MHLIGLWGCGAAERLIAAWPARGTDSAHLFPTLLSAMPHGSLKSATVGAFMLEKLASTTNQDFLPPNKLVVQH